MTSRLPADRQRQCRIARGLASALVFIAALSAQAQFVAFYDYAPGLASHPNAASTGLSGAVPLVNLVDGATTGVMVTVTNSGAVAGAAQGVPDYGTPASIVFDDFVSFAGKPSPGIELTAPAVLTYAFSGLNPSAEYNFQGTGMRGHFAYTNRWSLFEITGAASFASAHSAGVLTSAQVPTLAANQVVINTGNNSQGLLAWWEHIRPGANGGFSVVCKHYTGAVPGGSTAGGKGYAITGFRLEMAPRYTGRTNPPPRQPNPKPHTFNGVNTIFLIVMENHDWDTIQGSVYCPYINNTLLPMAAYSTRTYTPPGNNPSEPNYLWLIAGTNFNIRNDDAPSLNHQSSTNILSHLLDRAGISWKAYQEDISGTTVPDVNSGEYVARHNPFVFFDEVRTNLAYATNHIRPFTELARDLTNNTVARFNFITPNLTNDMHDTAPGSPSTRLQGDNWLARVVPGILASPAYVNGGLLIITWDEGSNENYGPFGTIMLSPRIKSAGYSNRLYYTHSSTLRTIQNILGVRPYLGDAAYANDFSDLFKTLQVTSVSKTNGGINLVAANLITGKTNYLQVSTNPALGNWATIRTNVATSDRLTLPDAITAPARYYRIVELP